MSTDVAAVQEGAETVRKQREKVSRKQRYCSHYQRSSLIVSESEQEKRQSSLGS